MLLNVTVSGAGPLVGFAVKLAANGAEALVRIEEEKPEVILLDVMMPVMSGWDVLARMNPADRDCIQVILVSGHTLPTEMPYNCIAGVLAKPVALDEIVQAIARALPPQRSRHRSAATG